MTCAIVVLAAFSLKSRCVGWNMKWAPVGAVLLWRLERSCHCICNSSSKMFLSDAQARASFSIWGSLAGSVSKYWRGIKMTRIVNLCSSTSYAKTLGTPGLSLRQSNSDLSKERLLSCLKSSTNDYLLITISSSSTGRQLANMFPPPLDSIYICTHLPVPHLSDN